MTNNFDNIWKTVVKINSFAGLFTFKENAIKNRKQECFKWFCLFSYIGINILLSNTVYLNRTDLMMFIISGTVQVISIVVGLSCFILVCYQEDYLVVLDWCRNIYDFDQYHPLVKAKAINQLGEVNKMCYKILNIMFVVFTADALCITLGFAIICQILPFNIVEEYQPPVPFYLPILEQNNSITYLITVFMQSSGFYILVQYYIYLLAPTIIVSMHFLKYLDLINETVVQMKVVLSRMQLLNSSVDAEIEIKEWTKRICDMITSFKK